jgi:hypothetical protein
MTRVLLLLVLCTHYSLLLCTTLTLSLCRTANAVFANEVFYRPDMLYWDSMSQWGCVCIYVYIR